MCVCVCVRERERETALEVGVRGEDVLALGAVDGGHDARLLVFG